MEVVEHGGFGAAARALHVAQPSLSQAIRRLETDLGEVLFDRAARPVTLTQEGQDFLDPARQLVLDVHRVREAMDGIKELRAGRLSVAALGTLASDPLPRLMRGFRDKHPYVRFRVIDPPGPDALFEQVRCGNAELGLTDISAGSRDLIGHELGTQDIVIVLPPNNHSDFPSPLPLGAISNIDFVLISKGTDDLLDTGLTLRGHSVRGAVECPSWSSLFHLVRAGAGAAIMSRTVAEAQFELQTIRATDPPIQRTIGLVHRPGGLSPASSEFLAIARRAWAVGPA